MKALDATDHKILALLQEDSNINVKQIAVLLKLTTTPIYERIKKLEKNGIIEKYMAKIDPKKLGLDLLIFTHVSLKEHTKAYLSNFESKIQSLYEVIECHHVSAEHDYLLKVMVKDMNAYRSFLMDKLSKIQNIGNVHSSFVVGEVKKDGIIHSEN